MPCEQGLFFRRSSAQGDDISFENGDKSVLSRFSSRQISDNLLEKIAGFRNLI
jgi:hypothetical protein